MMQIIDEHIDSGKSLGYGKKREKCTIFLARVRNPCGSMQQVEY